MKVKYAVYHCEVVIFYGVNVYIARVFQVTE